MGTAPAVAGASTETFEHPPRVASVPRPTWLLAHSDGHDTVTSQVSPRSVARMCSGFSSGR
jgi:hypothetical protein